VTALLAGYGERAHPLHKETNQQHKKTLVNKGLILVLTFL